MVLPCEESYDQGKHNAGNPSQKPQNCPKNLKDLAYKSILRPKLEYACSIWDPYTTGNIKTFEGVQRRSARFVCNKFSYHERVTSMSKELYWPSIQQRRAEKRMALFHRVVKETVDVDASALLTSSHRSSGKLNRVQYQTHSSKKDCYKYSYVPRSIIQWNNIDAPDDHKQFKLLLSSLDLHIGGDTYNYVLASQVAPAQMLLKERCNYTYRYRYRSSERVHVIITNCYK